MPLVIVIVAVLILAVGGIYYFAITQKSVKEEAMEKKDEMMKKDESAMMEKKEMTIVLNALNDSGQVGKAVFSDMNGETKVVINISPSTANVLQPSHIHAGACPNPAAVVYPLNDVINGQSETILDVSLGEIRNT